MIISGGAFSQYSPTVDTLYLYRGGEFYYYNTSGDTVFINADTIFKESGYWARNSQDWLTPTATDAGIQIDGDIKNPGLGDYTTQENSTDGYIVFTAIDSTYKLFRWSGVKRIPLKADTVYLLDLVEADTPSKILVIESGDSIVKYADYNTFQYFTTVDISRADVDILHTDSVVLIPAPGVNKYINVTNAVCRVSSIRTPNIGAGTLDMVYNTATGYSSADVIRRLTATSFNTIDTTQWDFPKMIITGSTNTNQINNKSVVLWLSSAQAGDATSLKIYITYQILDK